MKRGLLQPMPMSPAEIAGLVERVRSTQLHQATASARRARFIAMYKSGYPVKEIAAAVGRSVSWACRVAREFGFRNLLS